jgi:hypothetical protein
VRARPRGLFSKPLIGGSQAIMPVDTRLVKRFVVFYWRHYIFGKS